MEIQKGVVVTKPNILKCIFTAVVVVVTFFGIQGPDQAKGAKAVVVAKVKGKDIELTDLLLATAPYKYQYEQKGLDFSSGQGKVAYQRLQMQVLQQMIARELLQMGAQKNKITVSDRDIEKKYEAAIRKRKISEASFLKELSQYGWTKALYKSDLKNQLLEDKFINTILAPGKSGNGLDEVVGDWLQKEVDSGVDIYFSISPDEGTGGQNTAEKAGMEYYKKKYGTAAAQGTVAKATNYGCHTQIDIMKNGKIVKSLGYGGGEVYEIN